MRAVRFTFDGDDTPTFEGFTDETTWNGWPNVWVTPATRAAIVVWAIQEGDDETAADLARATIITDVCGGVVSLANGWTPTLLEDPPKIGDPPPQDPNPWELGSGPHGAVLLIDRSSPVPQRLRLQAGPLVSRFQFESLCARIADALNAQEA